VFSHLLYVWAGKPLQGEMCFMKKDSGKTPTILMLLLCVNIILVLINLLIYLMFLPNKANHIQELVTMLICLCVSVYLFYRGFIDMRDGKFTQRRAHLALASITALGVTMLAALALIRPFTISMVPGYYFQLTSWFVLVVVNLLYFAIAIWKRLTSNPNF
jgi:hypothetical protein